MQAQIDPTRRSPHQRVETALPLDGEWLMENETQQPVAKQKEDSAGHDRLIVRVNLQLPKSDGLLAYWKYNRLTSASQEGFNNKIGWLTRQAYGYRDEAFLYLKIYDLPNLSTRRDL